MKLSYFLFLLLAPFSVFSQNNSLPPLEASFFAVIVNDMDSSLQWYQKIVGFEIKNQRSLEERGIRQANLERGNIQLELIELKSAIMPNNILSEKPKGTRIGGFFKFGFKVDEFGKWLQHLTEAGVDFNGQIVVDPVSGKQMVIIKDPDGNRVQLFEK